MITEIIRRNMKTTGLGVTLLDLFTFTLGKLHFKRLHRIFHSIYLDKVIHFVSNACCETIQKYKNESVSINQDSMPISTIYSIWFQGEENAPEIVKFCLNRLRIVAKQYHLALHVYNEEELNKLAIDQKIKDKRKKGLLDDAVYSDICRSFLLSHYGGIWCDATLLVRSFPQDVFNNEFMSIRQLERVASDPSSFKDDNETKWTSFFMASQNGSIVTSFLYDMYVEYFSKYDIKPLYLLVDVILRIGYLEIPSITKAIDKNFATRHSVHELFYYLDKPYSQEKFDMILNENYVHKLSYKKSFSKEGTMYGALLSHQF